MNLNTKVLICGAETLLGPAIERHLRILGGCEVSLGPDGDDGWLHDRASVRSFFREYGPHQIYLAAGISGGIGANVERPAELMIDNLDIAANVIAAAHESGVEKLVYVASSCTYPANAPQPLHPALLLSDKLEPTNQSYALAKLAGIQLCDAYRSQYGDRFIAVIPANMFGPGDDFDPDNAHVIGALMDRMHRAKLENASSVVVWGTGLPRRDFIYVDDAAVGCIRVMQQYDGEDPINIGSGEGVTIAEIAQAVKEAVCYAGELKFDTSKPDGMPVKLLDNSAILSLGWTPLTPLKTGLTRMYEIYCQSGDVNDR